MKYLHTLSNIFANCTGAVNKTITQISQCDTDTGISEFLESYSGQNQTTIAAFSSQESKIAFTSADIKAGLDVSGLLGLEVDNDGLSFLFRRRGSAYSEAVHTKVNMLSGLLVPVSLSAGAQKIAEIQYECHGRYDGTHDPISTTINQAIPSDGVGNGIWCAGPASINGIPIDVDDVSITFGITIAKRIIDGHVVFLAFKNTKPSITLKTPDVSILDSLTTKGTVQNATASKVYLRKRDNEDDVVPNNIAKHIAFSMAAGRHTVTNVGGSHSDDGLTATIRMSPIFNGSDPVLTINTATTIA